MTDKIYIDNHHNDDEYEPTDSEDEYSDDEKNLLQEVRERNRKKDTTNREIMAFSDNSEDDNDDDDEDDAMHGSDIEDDKYKNSEVPDSRDWGDKSRNYYNTDFVDPDYSAYTAQEEELAREEENEAIIIQKRLAKQIHENDFQIDEHILTKVDVESKNLPNEKLSALVTTDFSTLSKREKQLLFEKDSPEFISLVLDLKHYTKETTKLLEPILEYVINNSTEAPLMPIFEFTQLYYNVAATYCSNICYYLLIKAKRIVIQSHPLTKRLLNLKNLLSQLKNKYEKVIRPQLEELFTRIENNDGLTDININVSSKKLATKLSILKAYSQEVSSKKNQTKTVKIADKKADLLKIIENQSDSDDDENGSEMDVDDDDQEAGNAVSLEDGRRSITYEIAKNKGLTPYRSKEQRNPRVRHRNKFRKALIRRKGAVRTVRSETKRYSGEFSGIKSTVSKSIKFKS